MWSNQIRESMCKKQKDDVSRKWGSKRITQHTVLRLQSLSMTNLCIALMSWQPPELSIIMIFVSVMTIHPLLTQTSQSCFPSNRVAWPVPPSLASFVRSAPMIFWCLGHGSGVEFVKFSILPEKTRKSQHFFWKKRQCRMFYTSIMNELPVFLQISTQI